MITDERCVAVLHRDIEVVRCERPQGHDGTHSGSTDRSSFDWSEPDASGEFHVMSMVAPSEDEERASYAAIQVERCIYCDAHDVEIAFVFMQPRGLRVAVPGRVGLCAVCHRLLRDGDFEGVLGRSRGTGFDDFPDDAVLDLIRASRTALPT
jgi:hypothetical protein